MATTATVILRCTSVPQDSRMTIHMAPDWERGPEIPAVYDQAQRQWTAQVEVPPGDDLVFKFLCEGQWQPGPNVVVPAADVAAGPLVFDDRSVWFRNGGWLPVDVPRPGHVLFDPDPDQPDGPWDVIVAGSGVGGGVLAHRLAAADGQPPRRVLVLEAGGFLFPTHVGNLPRRETAGPGIARGIWDLWYDYLVPRWRNDDPKAEISQGLVLGGRSLFWGALAPRMKDWEFADWPVGVAEDLRGVWYERAEQLLRVGKLSDSAYQSRVRGLLAGVPELADYTHVDAPVATEFTGRTPNCVPAGVFSTAELLIERKVELTSDGRPRYPDLRILLNQEVLRVETDGTPATARTVVATDHRTGRERRFAVADGGSVVLAAGTLGTPLVATASGLGPGNGVVGTGLTDHPIYVVPFSVPRGAPWFTDLDSSMTLSRSIRSGADGRPLHPYNIKISLNLRLTQSRMVEPQQFLEIVDEDTMPCEIVFLLGAGLDDGGTVQPDPGQPTRPVVSMRPVPVPGAVQQELDVVATAVVRALGGVEPPGRRGYAPLGGVAHEVGTMRMGGVVDENLRIMGSSNVYACDLSVFPTSPAANPTLTLAALALRLAASLGAA